MHPSNPAPSEEKGYSDELQRKLQRFLQTSESYHSAPLSLKPAVEEECERAIHELQEAIRQGADFDRLKQISVDLRIPLTKLERSRRQMPHKTHVAGPVEIWFETLYSHSKIGIGDTLEEAVEEAKRNILRRP